MLYLRTGLPGASKTLNTLKEVIEDTHNAGREIYYNNIKLLMLDMAVCRSFAGWFYGVYLPSLDNIKKRPVQKRLLSIHYDGELASLEHFMHLQPQYDSWKQANGDASLWLYWVKRCYPEKRLTDINFFLASAEPEQITLDTLRQFKLDFRHFDNPTDWYALPRASVIIIDECQQTFPPRPAAAKVPQHCAEFETHRHKGYDIHLITQDAKLLDNHVRRLVGRHIHFFNPFSSNRVTRYQADKVFDTDDRTARTETITSTIKRDNTFYDLYWSADIHTHKFVLPKKALLIFPLLAIIFGVMYFVISGAFMSSSSEKVSDNADERTAAPNPSAAHEEADGIHPFTLLPQLTPLGTLCASLKYAGFELHHRRDGTYDSRHYFNCEAAETNQQQTFAVSQNNEDRFVDSRPAALLLDTAFLQSLGFWFAFKNGVPVLGYDKQVFIFPRY